MTDDLERRIAEGTAALRARFGERMRATPSLSDPQPQGTGPANRHGMPTPSSASEAAAQLLGEVDLILDGGMLSGRPSTVVDLTGAEPRVLIQFIRLGMMRSYARGGSGRIGTGRPSPSTATSTTSASVTLTRSP